MSWHILNRISDMLDIFSCIQYFKLHGSKESSWDLESSLCFMIYQMDNPEQVIFSHFMLSRYGKNCWSSRPTLFWWLSVQNNRVMFTTSFSSADWRRTLKRNGTLAQNWERDGCLFGGKLANENGAIVAADIPKLFLPWHLFSPAASSRKWESKVGAREEPTSTEYWRE